MYGRSEHSYTLRRIGDVARDVAAARDTIGTLRVELTHDEPADTAAARGHLREAQVLLGMALARCDKAVAMLPTPVAP